MGEIGTNYSINYAKPQQSCSVARIDDEEAKPVKLSLEEKVSLIVLAGIGSWNKKEFLNTLQNNNVRCFHIFGGQKTGIFPMEVLNRLQSALRNSSYPPSIVSIDQEGGIVNRLGWAFGFKYLWLNPMVQAGDIQSVRETGLLTGKILKLFGINLNIAPVLDLNINIKGRTLSEDPIKIGIFGKAYMEGLLETGVGSCAKHFPDEAPVGDTHEKVIKIATPREKLYIKERYQPLIDAGVPAIMMSHVVFTAVDPQNPASLSKIWITEILRKEMKFKGVVITDAIDMEGIKGITPRDEAIARAFQAGVDIILGDANNAKETKEVLIKAVREGRISEARLDESVRCILEFSKRFPVVPAPPNKQAVLEGLMQQAEILHNKVFPDKNEK